MRIITKRALNESIKKYADARISLAIWEERLKKKNFKNHDELKEIFPHADFIPNPNFKHLTVFNIKNNDYRLCVDMCFNANLVFVKWFGTHANYDRINFRSLLSGGFLLC